MVNIFFQSAIRCVLHFFIIYAPSGVQRGVVCDGLPPCLANTILDGDSSNIELFYGINELVLGEYVFAVVLVGRAVPIYRAADGYRAAGNAGTATTTDAVESRSTLIAALPGGYAGHPRCNRDVAASAHSACADAGTIRFTACYIYRSATDEDVAASISFGAIVARADAGIIWTSLCSEAACSRNGQHARFAWSDSWSITRHCN